MIKKLILENVCELWVIYRFYGKRSLINPLTLLLWSNYGWDVYFTIADNVGYVYAEAKGERFVLAPFCAPEDLAHHLEVAILKFESELPNKQLLLCPDEILGIENQLQLIREFENFNYLYTYEQMYGFPGKKMQKKRNALNFFLKNFESSTKIELIDSSEKVLNLFDDLPVFVETSNHDFAKGLLMLKTFMSKNWSPKFSGIKVFVGNELAGVTFGILKDDVYEIYIELGLEKFKGIHQYLIFKNLEANQIKCRLIDRQDDNGNDNLRISKMSYNPLVVRNASIYKWKN